MVAIVPVAMEAIVATVVSNALSLPPSALLSLLCALTALHLLCVLRPLCALRLLHVLCLLCVLRLLLVLRLLCFSSASALSLLSFLCESRNGGSEKQEQNCCADNCD
jgi:hypothetical protein